MSRIRFEDTTPINKSNLNKLNNVVISPSEPTTGEEVWIQKGKNLFDKNDYNLYKGFIYGGTHEWVENNYANYIYLKVKPNTTYTISREIVAPEFAIGTGTNVPIKGQSNVTSYASYEGQTSVTVTTGSNDSYLYIYVLWSEGNNIGLDNVLANIQVEQGSTATSYEAYVDKKIHIKNDDGGYEEFYNEERGSNEEGSFTKLADGTLIQRGKYTTPSIPLEQGYTQRINLPLSFVDNDYNIIPSKMTGGSGGFSQVCDSAWIVNNSEFEITSWNNGGGVADPVVIGWVAIGKWK